jgi:hypothetical protein
VCSEKGPDTYKSDAVCQDTLGEGSLGYSVIPLWLAGQTMLVAIFALRCLISCNFDIPVLVEVG